MGIRARGGKFVLEPFHYWWRHIPQGMTKTCPSPIDAVMEVIMFELGIPRMSTLVVELGIDHAAISRTRHRKQPINHDWLLRASVFSGLSYSDLCGVAGEELQHWPHHRAWSVHHIKTKSEEEFLAKYGHEPHCNLMFPSTLNTENDFCDCAARGNIK